MTNSYFQILGNAGAGYSKSMVFSWRTGEWDTTDGDDGSGTSFASKAEAEQYLSDAKAFEFIRGVEIIETKVEDE